jgi:hypothetical protein
MEFKNIEEVREAGFVGFKKMKELFADDAAIPKITGVYLILNPTKSAEFLTVGTGGHFKGRNPNVTLAELNNSWVEDTIVVYIGKAGKDGNSATLQSRLRQYFDFGQGKKVGHWGGRYIWQLSNSSDLLVCWKSLPTDDPRKIESQLILEFVSKYSKLPFANLKN